MNKLSKLLVLALFVCIFTTTANAQYVTGANPQLSYKAMGNIVNSDGTKLSAQELEKMLSSELFTKYEEAKGKYKSGIVLTSVGTGLAVVGFGTAFATRFITETDENFLILDIVAGSGALMIIGGVVLDAIGIPKWVIGKNRLKNVAKEYNQHNTAQNVSMTVGTTHNGFGLALNF